MRSLLYVLHHVPRFHRQMIFGEDAAHFELVQLKAMLLLSDQDAYFLLSQLARYLFLNLFLLTYMHPL